MELRSFGGLLHEPGQLGVLRLGLLVHPGVDLEDGVGQLAVHQGVGVRLHGGEGVQSTNCCHQLATNNSPKT